MIEIGRMADVPNLEARIRTRGGRGKFAVSEPRSCILRNKGRSRRCVVKLVPINKDAACDAHKEDVQPEGDAAPQVDLKKRPSEPDLLRPPNYPLPQS